MRRSYEKWIEEVERLCKPKEVILCDGSEEEAHRLIEIGMKEEKINNFPMRILKKSRYFRS